MLAKKQKGITFEERPITAPAEFLGLQIPVEDIHIGKFLGKGRFGEVYKGYCLSEKVAIKTILMDEKISKERRQKLIDEFSREICLLSNIHSPYVAAFRGACFQENSIFLVMELCECDLFDYLSSNKDNLSLFQRLKFAHEICKGMMIIHKQKFIHRDLKLKNCLLDKYGTVKVSDFGLATTFHQTTRTAGTPVYMPPEVLKKQPYGPAVDVYSFGLLVWEIITYHQVFEGYVAKNASMETFVRAIADNNERPPIPTNLPEKLKILLQSCWDKDPMKRPTFQEIDQILLSIMVDAAIEDTTGRKIWKSIFQENPLIELEADWESFRTNFITVLGFPKELLEKIDPSLFSDEPLQPNPSSEKIKYATVKELKRFWKQNKKDNQAIYEAEMNRRRVDRQLRCLKLLLVTKRNLVGGNQIVHIEDFGRLASLFGPITIPHVMTFDESPSSGRKSYPQCCFLDKIESLMKQPWFCGEMDNIEAYEILRSQEPGCFLVRFSANPAMRCFSISFVVEAKAKEPGKKKRKVLHLRVKQEGGYWIVPSGERSTSIEELIEALRKSKVHGIRCPIKNKVTAWDIVLSDFQGPVAANKGYWADDILD